MYNFSNFSKDYPDGLVLGDFKYIYCDDKRIRKIKKSRKKYDIFLDGEVVILSDLRVLLLNN